MNKYSKRALKTTATVGMSLAMVLSAAAPVMAAGKLPANTSCVIASATDVACKDLFFDLNKAVTSIGLDELTVDSTATILGTTDVNVIATIIANKAALLAGNDYSTVKSWTTVTDEIASDTIANTTKDTKGMFATDYFTTSATTANTGGLVNYYYGELTSTGATTSDTTNWTAVNIAQNSKAAAAAVKAFEKMGKWIEDGYVDRLDETLNERFYTVYDLLEERTADYVVADEDVVNVFVAAWTTVLEQDLAERGTINFSAKDRPNFNNEVAPIKHGDATISLSSKTDIKGRISAIKNAPNYYRVKGDAGVQDIISQYEDLLGTITDLKDLLKDDAYVAYNKTKTKNADETVKSAISTFAYGTQTDAVKKAKALAKTLDAEQYEILLALKEDVLDNAYNFETKKVGNYYVDKSGPVAGFTSNSTVVKDLGTSAFLLELVDNKEGLFGFDVVLNHLADFTKAYASVTTDLAKITPANIKSSDKAKLEAAEDAYYELTDTSGKYLNNTTKDQKKELRRVKTTIENLREAFDNLGTTEVAGWYDMGNGNWGYNNEDGTPAAYKWVASGSNWYFVRDGKMARNTWLAANSTDWYYLGSDGKMATSVSVDGCWINSLGIYKK